MITSIRRGFATNSSSTHSLVILNPGDEVRENTLDVGGWHNFLLVSEKQKATYLLEQANRVTQDEIEAFQAVVFKHAPVLHNKVPKHDYEIDHQSQMTIPENYDAPGKPSLTFWDALVQFVMRPNVVVLGGNDSDAGHPALRNGGELESRSFLRISEIPPYMRGARDEDLCVRFDRKNKLWTVFCKKNGDKVRFDFNATLIKRVARPEPAVRASSPELCDMKITECCNTFCRWCYQASAPNGRHASFDDVCDYLWDLRDAKCFEVAFGGGEPTLHPRFADILRVCRAIGMVPNFSTGSVEWMKDSVIVSAVKECAGAFGVSLHPTQLPVATIYDMAKEAGLEGNLQFHYVVGSQSREGFRKTLKALRKVYFRPVVLLAPKECGRGMSFQWFDYSNWVDDLRRVGLYAVSIDTVLAAQSAHSLEACGVDMRTYEVTEGLYSCYIDAVEREIGISSFVPKSKMHAWLPDGDLALAFRQLSIDDEAKVE